MNLIQFVLAGVLGFQPAQGGRPAGQLERPVTVAATTQFAPHEGLTQIRWSEARDHLGENVVVVGRVIQSRRNTGGVALYFDAPRARGLQLYVRNDDLGKFDPTPEAAYPGKWVLAAGLIDEFRGTPQIVVHSPGQLRVSAEEPTVSATSRPARTRDTIRVGSYNTLNLFDVYDDPYTADETTPPKPRSEMEHLAASIRKLDADVLALVEVENRPVLERFVRTFLADMGYDDVILFEGNDGRGIDCAILSRLPVGPVSSYRHVRFGMPGGGKTRFRRDLLRARIEPEGAPAFDVFVVHLKSKRGESGDSSAIRMAEAAEVRAVCDETMKADAGARFVVCGDFNDTWDSDAVKTIRGSGAGELKAFFTDLPEAARITYNREPHRSMIDFVLCSPAMAKSYAPGSFHVTDGSIETTGSDHNPVSMEFRVGAVPTSSAAGR